MENETVIIITRGDDGWVLGGFADKESAKQYVKEEVEYYGPYECDYWKVKIGEGGSELNP